MTPEKYDQLLALYRGQLHGTAREELETELKSDASLQADYEDLILIENLSIEHKLAEVEVISQQSFITYQKREAVKKGAIALMGLLGVVAIVYYFYSTTEKESLKPHPLPVQQIKQAKIESDKITNIKKESVSKVVKTKNEVIAKPAIKEFHTKINKDEKTEKPVAPETQKAIETKNTALKIEDKPTLTKAIDPCIDKPLQVTLIPEATCPDEANGRVTLKINGGNPPISQKVVNFNLNEYGQNYLEKGDYQAIVEDSKHCQSIIPFVIGEKVCATDYEFNPSQGQTIHFDNTIGLLQVLTKTGQLYYETNLDEINRFDWNGRNNNDDIIPGFYSYRVINEQKEVKFGTITITQ